MVQLKEDNILTIENLCVKFFTSNEVTAAVKKADISVKRGKITALVGESGSGKSVLALTVMGLLEKNCRVMSGKVWLNGQNILKMSKREKRNLLGTQICMVFQDSSASLDPLFTVGQQVIEGILAHKKVSRHEAYQMTVEQFCAMQLPQPEKLMKKYPFELSGGMCQRVMIAIAIVLKPQLFIADEPTTALDVAVQSKILQQIYQACRQNQMGVLFITHDLGVVAEIADNVYIMRDGIIVENKPVSDIFLKPEHTYTKQLIDSIL